jgi:hypothetical protein
MNVARPYKPSTLADEWGVSAALIYKLCRQNKLRHFKIGGLIRIPIDAAQDYLQCQTSHTPFNDSGEASPLYGRNPTERADGERSTPQIDIPPKPRRGRFTPVLTLHRGQLAES